MKVYSWCSALPNCKPFENFP